MKAIYLLSLHLSVFLGVQGRIERSDYGPHEIVKKIIRKRTKTSKKKIDLKTINEFGNDFDEDNVAWDRILQGRQTSFDYRNEHCKVKVDPDIVCYLSDDPSISCKEYMEAFLYDESKHCELQVIFEYNIKNMGTATDTVTTIKTAINNSRPFSVQKIKGILNPGQSLTAKQESSYNFCSLNYSNLELYFYISYL